MNKAGLCRLVSEKTDIPMMRISPIIDLIFKAIKDGVMRDGYAHIYNFGKFTRRWYPGGFRQGALTCYHKPKYIPVFRPSAMLKETVEHGNREISYMH